MHQDKLVTVYYAWTTQTSDVAWKSLHNLQIVTDGEMEGNPGGAG